MTQPDIDYIVCAEAGNFQLRKRAFPRPRPGEALLRVTRVGICGTDLHAYAGDQAYFTYPRILGHELAAEVVGIEEGNPAGLRAGDRVIVLPYLSCGSCIACRRNKANCCADMRVLGVHADGGMQQYITVPQELLLPAGELSPEEITLVEPLAIGAHAIRRAALEAGETIAVVGCGPIGLGIIVQARIVGSRVIALDAVTSRLSFARDRMGAEAVVDVRDEPVKRLAELTGGEGCTAVFDATGNRRALESGVDYLAHGGRYVLVGLSKGELTFTHPAIHAKETSLLCSRNASVADFIRVREVLSSGKFPTDHFITHRVPYTEMIERFDDWLRPETGVIKAITLWD
jgi:2-desacetyl-2-hydroxyethyl bacteriochlorophyllide A dehydrogenase